MDVSQKNRLTSVQGIRDFMFGGQAEFTLQSLVTSSHFTYRIVEEATEPNRRVRHVFYLCGNDNRDDWTYLCMLTRFDDVFFSNYTNDMEPPVFKALNWFIKMLNADKTCPDEVAFLHTGTCSACGRKLTTPESIEAGMGPTCRSRL